MITSHTGAPYSNSPVAEYYGLMDRAQRLRANQAVSEGVKETLELFIQLAGLMAKHQHGYHEIKGEMSRTTAPVKAKRGV